MRLLRGTSFCLMYIIIFKRGCFATYRHKVFRPKLLQLVQNLKLDHHKKVGAMAGVIVGCVPSCAWVFSMTDCFCAGVEAV